jgi:uncharacterized protein (TIGR02145 family)
MKKKNKIWIYPLIVMGFVLILTNSCKKDENNNNPPPDGTVIDIDGNVYHSVTIGTQVWMVENLKTTKYNDGTSIPLVTDSTAWELSGYLSTPGYCWYNDAVTYKNTYGALYNWFTVNTGKLAPAGWHVPTDAEWTTLTTYLGGDSVAGRKIKETGTTHWNSPNTGATNESGFTGLPAGGRDYYFGGGGSFYSLGHAGFFWSSSQDGTYYAWYRYLDYGHASVGRYTNDKGSGFSVRCLKD